MNPLKNREVLCYSRRGRTCPVASTMGLSYRAFFCLCCLLVVITDGIHGADGQDVVVVTVHTTVRATPTIPNPPSYTSLDDFKDTVLRVSNDYRTIHDASPLVWNETLVQYSRKWAETCIWKHSVRPCFRFPLKHRATSSSSGFYVGWSVWRESCLWLSRRLRCCRGLG